MLSEEDEHTVDGSNDLESYWYDDSNEESQTTSKARSSLSNYCSLCSRSTEVRHATGKAGSMERRILNDTCDALGNMKSMRMNVTNKNTLTVNRRQGLASRKNMSFTNAELQRIHTENQHLLKKIMSHQKPRSKSAKTTTPTPRPSSSAINRTTQQKKIANDNLILHQKIQQAKSCATREILATGCRSAHL